MVPHATHTLTTGDPARRGPFDFAGALLFRARPDSTRVVDCWAQKPIQDRSSYRTADGRPLSCRTGSAPQVPQVLDEFFDEA